MCEISPKFRLGFSFLSYILFTEMLRKTWLLLLESIKTQYLALFKESSVSYLPFSALLTRYFHKLVTVKICTFA